MKKLIFTLVIALLGSVISFAQVEEAGKPMTAGVENSLNIRLLNANEKDVEKLWKAHIKSYKGKTKKDRKSGETFTDNALVPEISSNTIICMQKQVMLVMKFYLLFGLILVENFYLLLLILINMDKLKKCYCYLL